MRWSPTLIALVLAAGTGHAQDIDAPAGVIEGVVVDTTFQRLGGSTVRIVGAALVMTLHADGGGAFRVTGLPVGRYRLEVERGYVHEPYPVESEPGPRIDRDWYRCCLCAMERPHSIGVVPTPPELLSTPRGHVATMSTAQGLRLTRREILGH